MSNLSIIIPLHKIDENYKKMLNNALKSVSKIDYDIELVFAGPKEVTTIIKQDVPVPAIPTLFVENEKTDYCTLVNAAVNKITSPYFSVLEVDDEYTTIWFDNVEKYMAAKPNVSAFLPLTKQFDYTKDDKPFIGFLNEIAWAQGFTEEPGYLSHDGLMAYYDYGLSGAVIRKDDFVTIGGLKSSIKLFFWYEFLLRLVENAKLVYVIPKIGYHHFAGREDSMISEYTKTLSQNEAEYWLKVAQEEYMFKTDRKREYQG